MSDAVRLLHISDPHLFADPQGELRGVRTLESLQHVLEHAMAHRRGAEAVLCTGDIVNDQPDGYPHFARLLGGLGLPVYCIPGNHDDAAQLRAALPGAPFQVGGHVDIGRWRLILLDSCIPGATRGHVAATELQRLRETLAGSDRHVMVCLHHHPVGMASHWLDPLGLDNAEELLGLLDAHRQVRVIGFGHVHQCFETRRQGVRMIGTPSTCVQFLPLAERFAVDRRPPAYRRWTLHADGTVDTEVVWVDGAAGQSVSRSAAGAAAASGAAATQGA